MSHSRLLLGALRVLASALASRELASRFREESKRIFVQGSSAVRHPALCSVMASGHYRRPAAARSSASIPSPGGLRLPLENLFAKCGASFLRSLRKCRASALGAGPLAGFAECDPSRTREFNKTETRSCT